MFGWWCRITEDLQRVASTWRVSASDRREGKPMPAQLIPFNEYQFDRCALWLAKKLGKTPTQYDLIKFHIMTDIYHVLECGTPVIGGAIAKWPLGPAVEKAYARISPSHINPGSVIGLLKARGCYRTSRGTICEFVARDGAAVDEEEFSASEVSAMEKALKIIELDWNSSQAFFHDPQKSFVGKAWAGACISGPIDWNSIIDAYDAENGTDHSAIKEIVSLGV